MNKSIFYLSVLGVISLFLSNSEVHGMQNKPGNPLKEANDKAEKRRKKQERKQKKADDKAQKESEKQERKQKKAEKFANLLEADPFS